MSNENAIPYATTLLVRDTCLCLHVQRAARALARLFDEALKPVGLTNNQFSLMMSLNRPEPPPMGPVAELLSLDQTTLTAAVKTLAGRGLVKTLPNPKDRRGKLLALTPEGQRILSTAVPIWTQTHALLDKGLETRLGQGAPDRLRQDLLGVTASLATPEAAPTGRRSKNLRAENPA